MIAILTTIFMALVLLAVIVLMPWWITALVLIVGGLLLFVFGLMRAAAKPAPRLTIEEEDNVYEIKRGAP